jgi:predicted nuclease of restriction endonuclease-like RecB superfamily
MLTREQLRYKIDGDRLEPWLLRTTPSVRELAGDLLGYWRSQVGQCRGDLDDGLTAILYRGRSLQVAKGLSRVIEQSSRFDDPASMGELRERALGLSAERLRSAREEGPGQHRAALAHELGCTAEELSDRLYGDLPEAAVLREVGIVEAETVIGRYNTGLCQGLLMHAREMELRLGRATVGQQRALLKALRFLGLLATVRAQGEDGLHLAIAGPGSVLDQAQRYGQRFAQLLPAVACLPSWELAVTLNAPRRETRQPLRLLLDQGLGLRGESRYLSQVPEELTLLVAALRADRGAWQVESEPAPLPLGDGELLVPDLSLQVEGRWIHIEFFHRWHATALQRRLDQLARRPELPLLLGVDRALAKRKEIAPLLEDARFLRQGFCYSTYPGRRVITSAVAAYLGSL